jgi:dihydrofolate reductase
LARFRALSLGKTVVLGRKTLAALPGGRPLPGRRSIVLSRRPGFFAEGAETACSPEDALRLIGGEECFVIGGGEVYALFLPFCERAYVTRVQADFGADVFMPDLEAEGWALAEAGPERRYGGLSYKFCVYENHP